MTTDNLDSALHSELSEQITPLVFNNLIDTSSMTNVLLINSTLADKQVFYASANENTFPIIYDSTSKTDDLLDLLRQKFPTSSIQRISLVFHDRGPNVQAPFMNNSILFQESDLEEGQTSFTGNVAWLISCIKEFHVGHIDFLACNTLQYSNWKKYYALLASQTSVVVGASNDATGNMQYGGDWVMESTSEDVMNIYFNANISNYVSLLASSISQSGGTILLQMNPENGLYVQYSTNGGSVWTDISGTTGTNSWPVTFTNNTPAAGTILTIKLETDISMSTTYTAGTSGYFIAGSQYITFDGSGNYVRINGITSYPGFIQNGIGTGLASGQANVVVQNFITDISGSTLAANAGWLCQSFFGRRVSGNSITNCTNNGAIPQSYTGGIAGKYSGQYGTITFTNCTNSGSIANSAGGIAGQYAGQYGTVIFTNCTNSGTIANSGGGISGESAGHTGTATFTNCTNSGRLNANDCGGISGKFAGQYGTVTFTNCTNNGSISGTSGGGIAGKFAGQNGEANFMNCTNTGVFNANLAGGISGESAGQYGTATFTNCTNSMTISGQNAGGIAGLYVGQNGRATLTNCTNSGDISGKYSGGIIGSNAGNIGLVLSLTNCFSTGAISGQYAGGIAGQSFGYNSSANFVISGCYSTGAISGDNAGGITGANVGRNDNASYTPVINITNCYSLGNIHTTAGGICGGAEVTAAFTNSPTITITNCYSFGTIVNANSGIVSTSYPKATTQTNTYVAAGSWTDASANASDALTGTPTNINTNNPGTTWTTLRYGTPYVLSSYTSQLYSPNSASSYNNYTSVAGLFTDSSYNYQLLYISQTAYSSLAPNVATTYVGVSKGDAPYYNSYNVNTFTLTNSSGPGPITGTINASNGVINFIVLQSCFLEGTKILCFENNEEVYRPVENLRKGDLVKTIYNGYMPVCMLGTSRIYNPGNDYRIANRLYKCSREKYPTLFEDLYITGCHSILVPWMTDDQWENTKAVNGNIYVTDNHFRLIACADEKAEPFNQEGFMNIYHVALQHHDICMNYGIYANGLLVESCSIDYLIQYSSMKILGEQDSSVSEDVGNVSNNMTPQLVDTC